MFARAKGEVALEALHTRDEKERQEHPANPLAVCTSITSPPVHCYPSEPEPCSCAFNGRLTAGERFSAADSKRVQITSHRSPDQESKL